MSHEINQLDVSAIQLRDSKTQPKVSYSREIGEAQIIHNIFGKAKVRIIRKHDTFWRSLWLALAFIVSATSTYLLQTWYASGRSEVVQAAVSVSPSAPAAVTESVPQPSIQSDVAAAVLPVAVTEPAKPTPVEASNPAVIRKPVPQPQSATTVPAIAVPKPAAPATPVVVPPKPTVVQPKPVVIQPKTVAQSAVAGVPQTSPVDATMPKPQPTPPAVVKPLPPKQPVATAAAVAKPAVGASSPAAAPVQGAEDKEDTAAPVAVKQLSSPVEASGN